MQPSPYSKQQPALSVPFRSVNDMLAPCPYLARSRSQVSVYNFAWEDMTTPSMSLLTDIVRVAVSSLRVGGKVRSRLETAHQ